MGSMKNSNDYTYRISEEECAQDNELCQFIS
jgi:hypothetical protein